MSPCTGAPEVPAGTIFGDLIMEEKEATKDKLSLRLISALRAVNHAGELFVFRLISQMMLTEGDETEYS